MGNALCWQRANSLSTTKPPYAQALVQLHAQRRVEKTMMSVGPCKRIALQVISVAFHSANARITRSRTFYRTPLELLPPHDSICATVAIRALQKSIKISLIQPPRTNSQNSKKQQLPALRWQRTLSNSTKTQISDPQAHHASCPNSKKYATLWLVDARGALGVDGEKLVVFL